MKTRTHGLDEKEMELVRLLMADCKSTGDIQAKLKKLFAGTIEQMLEAEMDEHLGYCSPPRKTQKMTPKTQKKKKKRSKLPLNDI